MGAPGSGRRSAAPQAEGRGVLPGTLGPSATARRRKKGVAQPDVGARGRGEPKEGLRLPLGQTLPWSEREEEPLDKVFLSSPRSGGREERGDDHSLVEREGRPALENSSRQTPLKYATAISRNHRYSG